MRSRATRCATRRRPYSTDELYPALASLVDRTLLVPDEDTLATSRDLLLSQKILTESSDALATTGAPGWRRLRSAA